MSQSYIYIAEIVKISLKILEADNNSSSKISLWLFSHNFDTTGEK